METDEFKFLKPGEVRTRFAPSPTGFLHIGSAKTALFNYLFAKQNQGAFILRIEDTDKKRSNPEFEKDIIDSLKWLGIEWDEGPYRQSERLDIYEKYLKKLLDENKAYYCFCSEEELESYRQYQMAIGETPRYSGKCANFSEKEVKKYLTEGRPSVIRFRTPLKKIIFNDLIRGKIEFDTNLIGDFVIAKTLFAPLYNFVVTIDDFEMKISHNIRGEDHISNTPKQILIQEAFGFPQPQYAHLPLILGPDKNKLSKRHGIVSILEYRKAGYLPEALINFMAFLGWNPGDDREIYSMSSLIKEFSFNRVQKGGAIFNIKRLDFLNGFYIRQKPIEKLTEMCLPYLIEAELIEELGERKFKIRETGEVVNFEFLEKITAIYQERLKKLSEISILTDFFFKEKIEYEKNLLKWREMTDKEIKYSLHKLEKILSKIKEENWRKENLEKILIAEAEKFALEIKKIGDRGYLLWPFRVALSGKKESAGPFEIAEILGKEKVLRRIKEAKRKKT